MRRNMVVLLVGLLLGLLVAVLWATSMVGLAEGHKAKNHNAEWRGPGSRPVRITGTVPTAIAPGVSAPIQLKFKNPNSRPVIMRRVKVKVVAINAPHADAAHPCTRVDFVIRQMPRRLKMRVPAKRSVDLSALKVPAHQWPTFGMRNRPVNQDGCQGAHLTLGYKVWVPKVTR